jgi:hypothetical protein
MFVGIYWQESQMRWPGHSFNQKRNSKDQYGMELRQPVQVTHRTRSGYAHQQTRQRLALAWINLFKAQRELRLCLNTPG